MPLRGIAIIDGEIREDPAVFGKTGLVVEAGVRQRFLQTLLHVVRKWSSIEPAT
jgi:hypothetical protein